MKLGADNPLLLDIELLKVIADIAPVLGPKFRPEFFLAEADITSDFLLDMDNPLMKFSFHTVSQT